MNNEPVALTQGDILGILQDANSVPLGQPIFNSSEEYNKLKAIIESAIRYTHPVKELTDEEIKSLKAEISSLKRKVNHEHIRAELALANRNLTDKEITEIYFDDPDILVFARAILRKAQEK